jgi:ankyrin repeat protein
MAEISELEKLSKLSIDDHEASGFTEERHSQSTLALHAACESGNVSEVRNILAEGRADLNALIAGHRALRTALHKASAYGHTQVVQLLLKVSG